MKLSAVDLNGNATVQVSSPPLLDLSPMINLAWAESAL